MNTVQISKQHYTKKQTPNSGDAATGMQGRGFAGRISLHLLQAIVPQKRPDTSEKSFYREQIPPLAC